MTLDGNITTGMGTARKWVKMIEPVFKEKFDIQLFSGTLNVKLLTNYKVKPDEIIKSEEYGGTQNVFVQKCNIINQEHRIIKEVFIVRAAKNETKKGDYGTDILEIVSDVNLRETFNLQDDDSIRIEINDDESIHSIY